MSKPIPVRKLHAELLLVLSPKPVTRWGLILLVSINGSTVAI